MIGRDEHHVIKQSQHSMTTDVIKKCNENALDIQYTLSSDPWLRPLKPILCVLRVMGTAIDSQILFYS